MEVRHTKGGNIIWNCVEDIVIEEKENYKSIGIYGSGYNLFGEE